MAQATPVEPPETVIAVEPVEETGPVDLQLAVTYNGKDLELIAAFVQGTDGKMSAKRSELVQLGLPVEAGGKPDDMIALDSLKGITYVYDEAMQSIKIELAASLRPLNKVNASGREYVKAEKGGSGLVVNYNYQNNATFHLDNQPDTFDGATLQLDARAYAEVGVLRQTASIDTLDFDHYNVIRQDTTYSFSDQEKARTYRAGDVTTGGLNWTRQLNVGGAQVQRNFRLRPDLATLPLPLIEGTVDSPSTLRVFIGGALIYSVDLQTGPYRLENLPFYSGGGNIRVVITDASGRETVKEMSFYTAPTLLQKGLLDFSADAGFLRREVGIDPFAYDDKPMALGTVRYGISDTLTGEAHGEVNQDLVNLGLGAVWSLGELGLFNASAAGSLFDGGSTGLLLTMGWDARFGDFSVNAAASHTIGDYFDLAAATVEPTPGLDLEPTTAPAFDRISMAYAFRDLGAAASGSFVHSLSTDGTRSLNLSATWTQSLPHQISAYVSGNYEFGDEPGYGIFVGASMPLGERLYASSNYTKTDENWNWVNDVTRSGDGQPGSYGWRLAHGEGETPFDESIGNYVGGKARVDGRARHDYNAKTVTANAAVDGAVVVAGGGVFLSNRIYDSFAIVDGGGADVTVKYENREIGKTGKSGKLLVPALRSYDKNKIEIDTNDLPVSALSPETEKFVVPREFSGVVIDFGVKTDPKSALLILTDAAGAFIEPGAEVLVAGIETPFIMGYDGQVFLEGIAAKNNVTVKTGTAECKASFAYKPDPDNIATIGPVTCQ